MHVLLQDRVKGGPLRVRNYANLAKPEFQVGVRTCMCSHSGSHNLAALPEILL